FILSGILFCFFFQAEDGIRDFHVTGVQTYALPICRRCGGLCCASLLASAGRRLRGCVWLPPRQRTFRRTPPLESCVTIKRGLELAFECDLLVRWLGECVTHSIRGAEERRPHGGTHPRRRARPQRLEPLASHPVELRCRPKPWPHELDLVDEPATVVVQQPEVNRPLEAAH